MTLVTCDPGTLVHNWRCPRPRQQASNTHTDYCTRQGSPSITLLHTITHYYTLVNTITHYQTLLHTIILLHTIEHFCKNPTATGYCTREGSEVNHHLSTRCGRGYIYGKRVKKFWRLPKSRFEQKQSKISAKRSSIPLITTHRKDYGHQEHHQHTIVIPAGSQDTIVIQASSNFPINCPDCLTAKTPPTHWLTDPWCRNTSHLVRPLNLCDETDNGHK